MLSRRSLLAAAALPLTTRAWAQPKQDDTTFQGFRRDVLVRWGDRVESDAPVFTPSNITLDAAGSQFGWDGMVLGVAVGPQAADGVARGLLAMAHPTAVARLMFPGGLDHPAIAANAQGASILNIEKHGAKWEVVDGGYQSRRFTASTLCAITGPLAGAVGASVQGLIAVQAGCVTPWGTLLLAEGDPQPWVRRLPGKFARGDAGFGWVAEVDPFNPQAMPGKRTALGRFARAGVAATVSADGRAVLFMTDDRATGHLFRFVSDARAEPDNPGLLDSGTLSVAVAEGGWSLRFVAIGRGEDPLIAASRLGAEAFDAPAGMAMAAGGAVLLTCRGNAARVAPDALNPRQVNPDGHLLLLRPDTHDPAAEIFAGEIALLCGGGQAPWMSQPSSVTLGASGETWIGTDASGIVVAEPDLTSLRRVFAPPLGSMMGGVALTPDGTTLLSAVRHPGDVPGASFDRPATRWPSLRPDLPPQTTVVTLMRR